MGEDASRTHPLPLSVRMLIVLILLFQAGACVVGARPALNGQVDLRSFYAAGAIVRSAHASDLYDYAYQDTVQNSIVSPRAGALPFLYPSFAALPFVPLSLLSYRAAFYVVLLCNMALGVVAGALLRPWLPSLQSFHWATLPMLYGCVFGVSMALMQGQISFLLLVIYCGAWSLLQREKPLLAGLLMSLALAKFQIAIPVALLFLLWKRWRFVAGFATGALGLAGLSLCIIGRAGALGYWRSMTGMTRQTALHAGDAKARFGMFPTDMPNLHGLAFGLLHGDRWTIALTALLSCAVLLFAMRQRPSLLVALPTAMLVSYHMQPHDLTLLLLPLSVEIERIMARRRSVSIRSEWMLTGTLLLLVLPLAAVLKIWGMNYVVSLAVLGVMLMACRPRSASAPLIEHVPAQGGGLQLSQ